MKMIWRNDKGSALVSVIIVIAFISILATTMLYISGTNFQLKAADNKIKISFYDTEEPLDIVRADLVRMISDTMEDEIYEEVMASMGKCSDSGDVQILYRDIFYNKMDQKIKDYISGLSSPYDVSAVSYVNNFEDADDNYVIKNILVSQTTNGYTSIIQTDITIKAPDMVWPYYDENAKNTLTSSGEADKPVDYLKCVYYSNWVKK